jgi:hypothetical protein
MGIKIPFWEILIWLLTCKRNPQTEGQIIAKQQRYESKNKKKKKKNVFKNSNNMRVYNF